MKQTKNTQMKNNGDDKFTYLNDRKRKLQLTTT